MTVSHWADVSAEPAVPSDPLPETVDVAVIGAGYTGLSTALHAADAGLDVAVIEAREPGFGGSGRNVGLLNAGLWLPPDEAVRRLGPDRSRLIGELSEAPAYVMDLIERHQIRCDLTRTGTIHAAHSPAGMKDLADRHRQWQARGAPVTLLDRDAAAEMIGSTRFYGGLVDARAGTINPMGYARGLARAARAAGARLVTGCAVTRLEERNGWALTTAQGTVRARRVVLAANAYNLDLWPGLRNTFSAIDLFQIGTEPLGDRIARILPGGQGLWDTAPIMTYVRRDGRGGLVVGSMGRDGALARRWAAKRLQKLFPDLGPVGFRHGWHGRVAFTPDHLPMIYRLADRVFAPMAYNGRGIAPGTWFGKAMSAYLVSGDARALPLPLSAPVPVSARRLREAGYALAFTAYQAMGAV
ncbi:FAD-binding oxidoreductase [Mesobacterium sp. TK19101]|uniref:FAD-binding oxidoreductase n=1 Tax=Mesobacterium hydrothermale TaxID=3111907 RepID=A0ABU6HDQ1_9RHOB|nr:FAD-binding oxidoreductase [Mesobacterium sp. TK19101]MEC3860593.1 FAD-binding oxidoreductase [Mesobacterium sp. TK19101]